MQKAASSKHNTISKLDIVMLSGLGKGDGGRETWLYQFVPELLRQLPSLHLRVIGLKNRTEPENGTALKFAARDNPRLTVELLESQQTSVPLSMQFPVIFRRWARSSNDLGQSVLGVGSFVELTAILFSGRYRRAHKTVWLRTIWLSEKASRIPRILVSPLRLLEQLILGRADRIIANGEDTAAYYRSRGLLVEVVPNAVDGSAFSLPSVRLGPTIRIGLIGRIVEGKSVTEFLAAAQHFQTDNRFQFVIVGNPATDEVRRAASKGTIEYLPGVSNDQMKAMLETLDVCVALSKYGVGGGGGGVSNALLEQMAARRIIVAWDNPTYRQLLSEESAYLVPQGSVKGLIDALKSIESDKEDAKGRAEAAVRKSNDFNWAEHLDRFLRNDPLGEAVETGLIGSFDAPAA